MGFNSRMRHDRGSVLLQVLEAPRRSSEYYYRRLLLQLALVLALLAVKAHCSRPEVRAGGGGAAAAAAAAGRAKYVESTFRRHFWSTADADHYKLSEDGEEAELVLDRVAASGFASNTRYLFGRISIQMKVHPGDSAGTVTTFYTSSLSGKHDELDFEFLGNEVGKPYVLQTNVYASGVGDREQRIKLWFDPTADFHTYSIHWNKKILIFMVDETPIRIYKNNEDLGVPYPCRQPMSVFASMWNGEDWATQSGAIKLNWSKSPFKARYRHYDVEGCEVPWYKGEVTPCTSRKSDALLKRATIQHLNIEQLVRLQWVTENMLVYDYCTDVYRYPKPHPECSRNSGLQDSGQDLEASNNFFYLDPSHTSSW